MAPKRQPALKSPSSDSDSSEELAVDEKQAPIPNQPQISDSDEDEESSDEELQDDTKPSTEKSAPTQSDSSDDTSGSDTDTAPSPTASGFKIKPIDSKRMDKKRNPNSVGTKSTQPHSDSEDGGSGSDTESSDTTPSPMVSGVTKPMNDLAKKKKPAQNPNAVGIKLAATQAVSGKQLNEKDKKGKLLNGTGAVEEKKSPIVRIWSDDDEVAIVQGMFEYRMRKGCDPYADRDAFHEFMKKFLSIEVTKNQLMDKIRRLKSRYKNNVKKGKDQVSSKPRVLKLFELSKKVWGGDGAVAVESSAKNGKRIASHSVGVEDLVSKENNGEKSNKKAKKSVEVKKSLDLVNENGIDVVEDGSGLDEGFWDAYPHFKEALELENSGYFSKSGQRAMEIQLSKIGAAKEMDEKWKGFHVKEAELNLLRLELATEQTKLVLETMKAANP